MALVDEIKAFVLDIFSDEIYVQTMDVNIGGINYSIRLDISLVRVVENGTSGLTSNDMAQNIAVVMANLYGTSSTFDAAVSTSPVQNVTINFKAVPGEDSFGQDGPYGDETLGIAQINLASLDREYLTNDAAYIAENGYWARFNLQHIVNHELMHVFTGLDDGNTHLTLVDEVNSETFGGPVRVNYADSRPVSDEERFFEYCFPAGTPITLWGGATKPIEQITTVDKILTHDANGTPIAGIVDKLFTNTTREFIRLAFIDGRDDLITTPGHRFLTETGDYMEIGRMLRLGGGSVRVVDQSGETITATGEVLEYSAETADMFPVTTSKTIAFEGNAVLKQDVQEGWKTYNFEVREHHNYVANGIQYPRAA